MLRLRGLGIFIPLTSAVRLPTHSRGLRLAAIASRAPPVKAFSTADDEQPEVLSLQVSSPALLLNHMAERYASTSRILMEFVDNSLDDAESIFDNSRGAYAREVTIDVFVSRANRTLRIVDNCNGMPPSTLSRVVMRVGESRKRGASFVNGQFGFGMQSFRAACSMLTVASKAGADDDAQPASAPAVAAHRICVEREQSDGFRLEALHDAEAPGALRGGSTGTEVTLSGFDPQWIDDSFRVEAVHREIRSHFERLLDREGLSVRVWDADHPAAPPLACEPIDYAAMSPGASVRAEVELGGGQVAVCNLCVLSNATAAAAMGDELVAGGGDGGGSQDGAAPPAAASSADASSSRLASADANHFQARFFVGGRRIAACGGTPSFARQSVHRWTVWAHPQVVGFIDVVGSRTGPLQPVITRDEFKNTRGRTEAYEAIMAACEAPLELAIQQANQFTSAKSFSKLEQTLTEVLAKVAEDERRQAEEYEKQERLEMQRLRRAAAALKKAEAEAAAAAEAVRAAEAEEEAARPLADKVANGLGNLLGSAVSATAENLQRTLDPSVAAAEEAAARAKAAEEAAAAEEERQAKAAARREKARGKKLAPAPEEFAVRLVRGLPDHSRERSRLVGSVIYVDADHPDFQARWRQTRQGAFKVDERLCGYLATVVSSHYRERAYQAASRSRVDYAQAYEEMIGTYCRLEEGLRAVLPALLKEMEAQGGGRGGGDGRVQG